MSADIFVPLLQTLYQECCAIAGQTTREPNKHNAELRLKLASKIDDWLSVCRLAEEAMKQQQIRCKKHAEQILSPTER